MIANINLVFTEVDITNLIHEHIAKKLDDQYEVDGVEVNIVRVGNETRADACITLVNAQSNKFFS